MQELQDDFGMYPTNHTRFNSTVIDDDDDDDDGNIEEHRDCQMEDDDRVEILQPPSASFINEKCLLDELLQTEEVKKKGNNLSRPSSSHLSFVSRYLMRFLHE